jgi:hypothetical protein
VWPAGKPSRGLRERQQAAIQLELEQILVLEAVPGSGQVALGQEAACQVLAKPCVVDEVGRPSDIEGVVVPWRRERLAV